MPCTPGTRGMGSGPDLRAGSPPELAEEPEGCAEMHITGVERSDHSQCLSLEREGRLRRFPRRPANHLRFLRMAQGLPPIGGETFGCGNYTGPDVSQSGRVKQNNFKAMRT